MADARPVPLPPPIRLRVLELAGAALTNISELQLSPALRPIKRFTPSRRARLGGTAIASGLETDAGFRQGVAEHVRQQLPELSAAVDAGSPPGAADPVEVAALVYLLRPDGWRQVLSANATALEQAVVVSQNRQQAEAVPRLQEQLSSARAQAKTDLDRMRAERDALKVELVEVRRALGEATVSARRAEDRSVRLGAAVEELRREVAVATKTGETEARRLRKELAGTEAALETARRAERDGRSLGTTRARLLLDVLTEASAGLARELALPSSGVRPADLVEAVAAGTQGTSDLAPRALGDDSPALLDQLLNLPRAHLVVDGYNVTKTGYGTLPLDRQRARLVNGLATLVAQTGAEVTCCFDGALEGSATLMGPAGGVRVLFSRGEEIADELIRRLVANEPPGRPVIVVSSDREVADGVRRSGARPVPAEALLRRLERS